jgi:hypothetical protein
MRLLGRYRNVCCDGSPRGDWFAPAIATSANPPVLGIIPAVLHRNRRWIVHCVCRESVPRPQPWPDSLIARRTSLVAPRQADSSPRTLPKRLLRWQPRGDWLAPAIATLATPSPVAEAPLFRHRTHCRIVPRMW